MPGIYLSYHFDLELLGFFPRKTELQIERDDRNILHEPGWKTVHCEETIN
jgi:hypothetical protein